MHEDLPEDLTVSGEASLARHLPVQPLTGTHTHAAFTQLADERYGTGCYAYLWSYVIAKDLFSAFDPDDLQSPGTAHRFRDRVLAAGGSRDGHDLVEDFLGRPFSTEAFHRWLSEEVSGGSVDKDSLVEPCRSTCCRRERSWTGRQR